ncbi:melanoma-associated antigen B3 [Phlebotomus argentipes]|uniref:melanoma-associated antigen B3 n=1 Tax=Phlebotomus argentipes TaxID=94469 RepID=UPI002892F71C|nr:melanoma-associated antigen B3 [Phlebotomus argentipes]
MSCEESAIKVVKFILNVVEKRLPIKRGEIMGAMNDGFATNKTYPEVMVRVEHHLAKTFGYAIQDVMVKNTKSYIVVPKNITSHLVMPPGKWPEVTLLYLTLTYIFMKGGKVAENTLWRFLGTLNISQEERSDGIFRNANKLLTETFVKQLYLVREKDYEEGGDADFVIQYSWGPRSEFELSKKAVLDYVAQVLKRPARSFILQYRELYGAPASSRDGESSQAAPSSLIPL